MLFSGIVNSIWMPGLKTTGWGGCSWYPAWYRCLKNNVGKRGDFQTTKKEALII